MGVRENKIEKYLDEEIEKLGGFTRKWVSPGNAGVPDRIVFLNGAHFVELKTIDGVVSSVQEREFDRIYVQGCDVNILCSKKAVDHFIAGIT